MTTRKLDKTDFDQLLSLQESYQQVTGQLANCTIQEELMQDQLESIRSEKQVQLQKFKDLQQQENKLIDSLKEKYGDGEINITDGTFTAIS